MNDRSSSSQTGDGSEEAPRRKKAGKAVLAIPRAIFMPFIFLFRSLRGIWADPASRGILVSAVILLLAGTVIFMWVEGFSPIDSFYFCFITLATIGYGDFSPSTDLGKILTVLYGIAGLGIIAALISAIGAQRVRSGRAAAAKDTDGAEDT